MRVATEAVVDAGGLDGILRARDGLIREEPVGDGVFVQGDGPLRQYRRRVVVAPVPGEDGRYHVVQTVEFQLGLPYFSFLFAQPLRRHLGRLGPGRQAVWWAPPQRLSRRSAVALATLSALAVVVGYVGVLLGLTMTYAAAEFAASRADQGFALGAVRANVVLALAILAVADRRGRRPLILGCAAGAAALTALGALAPSLAWLTVTQIAAVALTAALLVLVGVMAAEEMPAGSRAWALAVLTMSVGLGGGVATAALPLAGLGPRGWRWLFAGALAALPLVADIRRHLPESRRWRPAAHPARHAGGGAGRGDRRHRHRLVLLCTGGFLFSLFATPSGQFQNEYLRTERMFSASRISLFSLLTGTIGGAGVLIGGRMADVRGRRLVAAAGTGAGIVTTLGLFLARGWPLWAWGVADSVIGYAVAPALAVYGPELFPTSVRSRATGVVAVAYAAGGVVGLIAAGSFSQHFGTFAPAFAVLAVGPAVLVVLIVRAYPETAGRELEELNPEDRPP